MVWAIFCKNRLFPRDNDIDYHEKGAHYVHIQSASIRRVSEEFKCLRHHLRMNRLSGSVYPSSKLEVWKRNGLRRPLSDNSQPKLQALVQDILPPTTAMTGYATGLGKLSANGQFFVGAQTAVTL